MCFLSGFDRWVADEGVDLWPDAERRWVRPPPLPPVPTAGVGQPVCRSAAARAALSTAAALPADRARPVPAGAADRPRQVASASAAPHRPGLLVRLQWLRRAALRRCRRACKVSFQLGVLSIFHSAISVKCFLTGVESSMTGFCKLSISLLLVRWKLCRARDGHFAHGFFAPLDFLFWIMCSFKLTELKNFLERLKSRKKPRLENSKNHSLDIYFSCAFISCKNCVL